ncbi:MAG: DUF2752 domain-containing protein [Nocardioides sp.]|uniref:DUF2752 domain-containing protein n=1 Tax=Nocardioides sp. TaxID=35761 RepID=UPI0039E69413
MTLTESRAERLRAPALTIGGLAAATLALHLRDPHDQGAWGFCPLYKVTGIYCPGCGGLRAVNDLTDGHVGQALSSNLLVTVGIPVAVVLLALWFVSRWRDRPPPRLPDEWSRRAWTGLAAGALLFTLLRNTPAGSWLAP